MSRSLRASLALLIAVSVAATATAKPNLIPNPGFEIHTQCPDDIEQNTGQIHFAAPWTRAGGTPDYFHACGLFLSVQTPNNQFGSQCPREPGFCGSTSNGGYAGILCYHPGDPDDSREYIQVSLTSSLTAGKKYRVRYWASLADRSRYAVDRMGAYLTVGPVPAVFELLPFAAQVESPMGAPLSNTVDWTLISGKVAASGGENQLVIGNFRTAASLQIVDLGPALPHSHAYYYIDEVTVRRADITDITALPPGNGGSMTTPLANAPPNAPAWLYCSLGTGSSTGADEPPDLTAPSNLLAQTTTDSDGNGVFTWLLEDARPCTNPDGSFFVEALTTDPVSGEASDSNELMLSGGPTITRPESWGGLKRRYHD